MINLLDSVSTRRGKGAIFGHQTAPQIKLWAEFVQGILLKGLFSRDFPLKILSFIRPAAALILSADRLSKSRLRFESWSSSQVTSFDHNPCRLLQSVRFSCCMDIMMSSSLAEILAFPTLAIHAFFFESHEIWYAAYQLIHTEMHWPHGPLMGTTETVLETRAILRYCHSFHFVSQRTSFLRDLFPLKVVPRNRAPADHNLDVAEEWFSKRDVIDSF